VGKKECSSDLIKVLANVLEKLIDVNVKCQTANGNVTKFQSSYAPEVSILSYLERIRKYARCSESCFVVALIYIDRMIEMRNIVLSNLNVHRVVITSVLIAAKFLDDLFYNNAFYARLGGISTGEMNTLELEFLHFIGFSLNVSPDVYAKYQAELEHYDKIPQISLPSAPLPKEMLAEDQSQYLKERYSSQPFPPYPHYSDQSIQQTFWSASISNQMHPGVNERINGGSTIRPCDSTIMNSSKPVCIMQHPRPQHYLYPGVSPDDASIQSQRFDSDHQVGVDLNRYSQNQAKVPLAHSMLEKPYISRSISPPSPTSNSTFIHFPLTDMDRFAGSNSGTSQFKQIYMDVTSNGVTNTTAEYEQIQFLNKGHSENKNQARLMVAEHFTVDKLNKDAYAYGTNQQPHPKAPMYPRDMFPTAAIVCTNLPNYHHYSVVVGGSNSSYK